MAFNPYQKYQQQSVMTMTQGEMVVRLYDEIIRQLSAACTAIDQKNVPATNAALQKAQKILNHLRMTLNFKCEISNNLDGLYAFFIQEICKANVKKEKGELMEIVPLISELRDSFAQAEKQTRMTPKIVSSAITSQVQTAMSI